MIKYYILDKDTIDFECDPTHDNSYDTCYANQLTKEELIFLLSKLEEYN